MRRKKITTKDNTAGPSTYDYIVYTDGGCAVNPGGPGGIGVVIIDQSTGEIQEISRGYASTTNNRMEIMAIIAALEIIPEGKKVKLYSDSQYALNCLAGLWEKKSNTDLWRILEKKEQGKYVDLQWVKGHNGTPENERCDELATMGMANPIKEVDTSFVSTSVDRSVDAASKSASVDSRGLSRINGGAMGVKIEIPDMLRNEKPDHLSVKQYTEKYNVKPECAKAIIAFYATGNHKFKSYIALKSGGIDAHSRKKAEDISKYSADPELYIATLQKYLSGNAIDAAARWNSRGLTLYDSIRKALVDEEVKQNCW